MKAEILNSLLFITIIETLIVGSSESKIVYLRPSSFKNYLYYNNTAIAKSITDCSQEICIITPVNDTEVEYQPLIKGKVKVANVSKLLVLVKPLAVAECWVQPEVQWIDENNWILQAFIGNIGKEDIGKSFLIQAIGNPVEKLQEGDIGSCNVKADFKSNTVLVRRK